MKKFLKIVDMQGTDLLGYNTIEEANMVLTMVLKDDILVFSGLEYVVKSRTINIADESIVITVEQLTHPAIVVHTLSSGFVATQLEMDYDDLNAKKKLLINNDSIPYEDRLETLKLYNSELTRLMDEKILMWTSECTDNHHPEQFHL